jgi:butyryl-CoA dehydrogenase
MQDGAGLRLLRETIAATAARADGSEWADLAGDLREVSGRLSEVTTTLWSTGDPQVALANATAYLDVAGHLVVAWLWLEQVLALGEETGDFADGKRAAARWFAAWELPTVRPLLDRLAALDRTALDTPASWF